MGTGGGPTNPDGDANPFGNPDGFERVSLNLTVGQVNNEQHGTATERPENNRAVDAEETIIFRFRANNNLPPNGLPLTLSTANEGTQIPTQITVFTVDENGNEEAVDGGDSGEGNTVLANSDRSIINLVFNDNQDYNIKVKNVSEDTAGTVQLNVNWTKQVTPAQGITTRFSPQVYTLDGTHTWTNSMITETQNALDLWSNTITDMPEGGGSERLLDMSLAFDNFDTQEAVTGEFGRTTVLSTEAYPQENPFFNRYPTSGRILINTGLEDDLYDNQWLNADQANSFAIQDVVLRQAGQALGIGGVFWERTGDQVLPKEDLFVTNEGPNAGDDPKIFTNEFNGVQLPNGGDPQTVEDTKNYLLYGGDNVLQIYRSLNDAQDDNTFEKDGVDTNYVFEQQLFNVEGGYFAITGANVNALNFIGLPIVSNASLHPFEGAHGNEDGDPEGQPTFGADGTQTGFVAFDNGGGNVIHLGLGDEIMTSFYEANNRNHPLFSLGTGVSHPMSAISTAFLEDLGYDVNYANAQSFSLGESNNIIANAEGL